MKTIHVLSLPTMSALALLVTAGHAQATIPLPDIGVCSSPSPNACLGISNSGSGVALSGTSTGVGNGTGLKGITNTGVGVLGTATTGTGIKGTASPTGLNTGVGVLGTTSNLGYGVEGTAAGGTGVYGTSNTLGVYGFSNGTGAAYGVEGKTNPSGTGAAIYGDAGGSFNSWAGLFHGDVSVLGGGYYQDGVLVASDARLKKDVKDMSYGLEQVLKLRPVTYKWKDGKDGATKLGFIAQEVQKTVPEVVSTNRGSGMLAVDYMSLIPVATKAIQEQEGTIQRQAKVIQQLDARIAALEQSKKPVASSSLPGAIGAGLAFGLLPLGLIGVRRRRRNHTKG
jgi:hypothetical protein